MAAETGRSASIDRHFLLVSDLLRGRAHDRGSLSKRLGVRPAMADRLIRAARKLPGVVAKREGRQLRIRMDRASLAPAPSYPMAVAACFGASLWPLFRGSTYETGIRDALAHVTLGTKRRAVFKDIDRKFWFLRRGGEAGLSRRSPLLDEAIEAVLHHRKLALAYTRFDGTVEGLRVEPLSIVVHDHQLYVIGRTERGGLHPYRFSRIASIDVLDATFRYPSRAEYDPERVFKDSFGVFVGNAVRTVTLRLHRRWGTYARTHRWHDSQVVTVKSDRVELMLRVGIDPELEAWILGFGEQATVIAPEDLRRRVASRLSDAARSYVEAPRLKGPSPRAARSGSRPAP